MKRFLLTWTVLVGMLLPVCSATAETIKMGYWIHKPHHYLLDPAGKPRGATIAYFDAVAAKMGYTVEWVGPLPFLRMIEYLNDGTIDGSAHLIKGLSSVQETVTYADQPFHYAQTVFVVRKENPVVQITSGQDVAGWRIGFVTGLDLSPFVAEHAAQLRMDTLTPNDAMWEQNLTKLIGERIEAVYELNAFTLEFIAKQMGIDAQIKTLPLPEPPTPVYIGFSKKSPKYAELLEKYNAIQNETPFTHEDYVKLIQQEFEALDK